MTLPYPYPYKDLCYSDLSNKRYIGILLGRFPGRYTRPKTGIFSWSQYELSHLQNFVLRHIGGIAPLRSRDCPISRLSLTFTHGEISQKIFPKNFGLLLFSQFFASRPALTRRIRTVPQESTEPAKTPVYVTSRRNFSKFFFPNFFPKFLTPRALASKCAKCYITKNFSQKFFSKKFWNFIQSINTPPVRS